MPAAATMTARISSSLLPDGNLGAFDTPRPDQPPPAPEGEVASDGDPHREDDVSQPEDWALHR